MSGSDDELFAVPAPIDRSPGKARRADTRRAVLLGAAGIAGACRPHGYRACRADEARRAGAAVVATSSAW